MCKCCDTRLLFALRVIYASIGILVGLSVCVVFTINFGNERAGAFGLTSAVFAAVTLAVYIYLYVVKETLRRAPKGYVLTMFGIIGTIGIGVGVGAFVAFLGLGIIDTLNDNEPSLVKSHYIVCVWAFMNFKWGLTTFLYAILNFKYVAKIRGYRRVVEAKSKSEPVEDDERIQKGEEYLTDVKQEEVEA